MARLTFWLALIVAVAVPAQAETARIAVAANFLKTAEVLAAQYRRQSGHEVAFSAGATGVLYAQIVQMAPFDAFLSADRARAAAALAAGLAVPGSDFTYARGILALYAPTLPLKDGGAVLAAGQFSHLAVADPQAAPFGAAALATLRSLGLDATLVPKLVTGVSVAQAQGFIESGNAELGFVALSQVIDRPPGTVWRVPAELYPPLAQDAVLLIRGQGNVAARGFLDFLKTPPARALIAQAGYG